MNILSWINGHESQLIAFLAACFGIWTAKKLIPKQGNKERGSHARWACFIIYALSGLALAVAAIPTITWLVSFGASAGLAAIVGNLTAVVTLALGWHAVARIVSMIRDLADKVPDHEARSAALWVPTFLPIGGAAVMQLLQNPQGIGQGITAAVAGAITLVYTSMIVKRADGARNHDHKNKWNWFAFAVLILGGIVIIPLVAYVDTALIARLPGALPTLTRVALGLGGIGLIVAGIADIWIDRVPDAYARAAARFGIALSAIFGASAVAAITTAASHGASSLNGVF
jgi:hypothetical protein